MKILYLAINFPPSNFGGKSGSVFQICNEYVKRNIDLKVITTNYKLPPTGNTINKWIYYSGISEGVSTIIC